MNIEFMCNDLMSRAKSIYAEIYSLIREFDNKEIIEKELRFEIDDNDEINGRAWCTEREDHIIINRGVISHFLSYFESVNNYYVREMLQRLMPNKEECLIEKMTMEGVIYEGKTVKVFDSKYIVEERTKLLEIFVARFILLHEMGHIFNGHCEYLYKKEKNFKYLSMYPLDNTDRDYALNRRTLEMDADAFATTRSFHHLFFLFMNFSSQVKCEFLEPVQLFYWWSFAIRSHFLLCEDKFMDTNKFTEGMYHLPSNARWCMIINEILELINLNSDMIEVKQVTDLVLRGAREAEQVFNAIKYTDYHIEEQLRNNKEFAIHHDQVNENWKKMLDELTFFSRCPLYKSDNN